jgi:hypothetical protein
VGRSNVDGGGVDGLKVVLSGGVALGGERGHNKEVYDSGVTLDVERRRGWEVLV